MKFNLPKIKEVGIAVDIDETLSWSVYYWVEGLRELFGNPENLSVEELIKKYRYTQNVPYWQSAEAQQWIEEKINCNATQRELPLIKDANNILRKITEIVPVAAYITARPEAVLAGTTDWLSAHDFPTAPVICRPTNIPSDQRDQWKAAVLEETHPAIKGIIDDNSDLLKHIGSDYEGFIFLYDSEPVDSNLKVISCK
ncbi:MAG: hypothetical protein ABH919_03530, partial [bacterium]